MTAARDGRTDIPADPGDVSVRPRAVPRPARLALLVSASFYGYETDAVAASFARRGFRTIRLDTDLFPTRHKLCWRISGEGAPAVSLDGEDLEPDAVWVREIWPPEMDPALQGGARAAAQRECKAALRWGLDALEGRVPADRWVNAPDAIAYAENKPRQLRLARLCGLDVPETWYGNDPAAARAFVEAAGDAPVAAKMLTQGIENEDGPGFVRVYTRRLRPADLPRLGGLRLSPTQLQRYVRKSREIRAAWIDGRVFAAALDGDACGDDWRIATGGPGWGPWTMSAQAVEALSALMRRLGLRYGAADFIVDPEGRYWFLEVNPTGSWGLIQYNLGLPVAEAIAEACAGGPDGVPRAGRAPPIDPEILP